LNLNQRLCSCKNIEKVARIGYGTNLAGDVYFSPKAVRNVHVRRNILDESTADALAIECDALCKRLTFPEQSAAHELQAALPDWRRPMSGLGRKFIDLSDGFRVRFETRTFLDINKLVIVDFALRLAETLVTRNLPDEIVALYPAASQRLLTYIQSSDQDYYYPNDNFLKDLWFTSGLTVPCGAQVVELRSIIGYRASARWMLRRPCVRYAQSILRSGQIVPWLRIHTESRYLADFNEQGWDACYLRIAALLRAHPEALGMAGTSWFYDPQLESVSPRLSYLRKLPMERGASVVRSGTSEFDIRSATAKSESRRRLYEAGKYVPVSYTLLWPRQELLAWVSSQIGRRPHSEVAAPYIERSHAHVEGRP
jgi:hypothetical protein